MKLRSIQTLIVCAALALAVLACDLPFELPFSTGGSKMPQGIQIGDDYECALGGFRIKKISGYTFSDESGIVTMTLPGSDIQTGPNITAIGWVNPVAVTNQQSIDSLKAGGDVQVSGEKEVQVGDITGLQADLAGTVKNTAVKGRVAAAVLGDKQQFMLVGVAPAERWEGEVLPVFEAALKTVSLFKIEELPTPQVFLDTATPIRQASTPALTRTPTQTRTASPTGASPTRTLTGVKASATPKVTAAPQVLRQWAKSAAASSQYGNVNWAASQAAGAPDTPTCGDKGTAWAAAGSNTQEWIELTYETPVIPTEIVIYQTYHPSAVTDVTIISTNGEKFLVHSGSPEAVSFCPDVYTISLELNEPIYVNKVRVAIDQSFFKSWTEIDAVELAGIPAAGAPTPAASRTPTRAGTAAPTASGQKTPTPIPPAAGSFNYQVTGAGEDALIPGGTLQYQSTSLEAVIGLVSANQRYAVSLFLSKTPTAGQLTLKPYDPKASGAKNPSAAVFIGAWFYYAQAGTLKIDKVENGKISGSFSFTAGRQDDPTRVVTISGVFSQIEVK